MFAQLEFLCHLAHDVKKLFSVRGKLTVSSDLSSNLSDTQKTARLESTGKINLIFDLHKTQLASKTDNSSSRFSTCITKSIIPRY